MISKLLIGIIIVMVGFLMTGEIMLGAGLTIFGWEYGFHLVIWIPLAVWIFFVWMIWKERLLYDRIETRLTERCSRWLRAFLMFGGISYGLWWICIIYSHPRIGWFVLSEESPLNYIVALICAIGSISFMAMSMKYFVRRRRAT